MNGLLTRILYVGQHILLPCRSTISVALREDRKAHTIIATTKKPVFSGSFSPICHSGRIECGEKKHLEIQSALIRIAFVSICWKELTDIGRIKLNER